MFHPPHTRYNYVIDTKSTTEDVMHHNFQETLSRQYVIETGRNLQETVPPPKSWYQGQWSYNADKSEVPKLMVIKYQSEIMSACKNKDNANSSVQPFSTLGKLHFSFCDSKAQNLIREATEARNFAYCPYSNFQVGAAVLCTDGTVYTGCNVENNSFTVGVCAESSSGISGGLLHYTLWCLQQFMSEFGDIKVYIAKPTHKEVLVTSISELLPYMFTTKDNSFK
nr:unnamed protein product [Callosobruchus analis]